MLLVILIELKDLEALNACAVQLRSAASSSQNTVMLSCLEFRPLLIERIASEQRDEPLLAERIKGF